MFETPHRMKFSKSISVQKVGIHMLRVLACLVLVGTITWIAFSVLNVNALIAGFAYVLAVLVVAARWGLTESFVTSVAAMLCLLTGQSFLIFRLFPAASVWKRQRADGDPGVGGFVCFSHC